jgi:hypothetical protein
MQSLNFGLQFERSAKTVPDGDDDGDDDDDESN